MTSPSICRQHVYDCQTPVPQPIFGMPVQPHIPPHFQAYMPAYYSSLHNSGQVNVPHYMPYQYAAQEPPPAAPQLSSHH